MATKHTRHLSPYHSLGHNSLTLTFFILRSGRRARGVLELPDLLGGPGREGLGLAGLGPPAGRQEVGDGLHIQQGHDGYLGEGSVRTAEGVTAVKLV